MSSDLQRLRQSESEISLPGCTPTPLASYLKALAVLRLVCEAGIEGGGDPDAVGFWREDLFVLRTRLTSEELQKFFLNRYRPTPLVAPWNGGSGFYPKDNTDGIIALAGSIADRFEPYREAIAAARYVVARMHLVESPKQKQKSDFLQALRNVAPELLLLWMDAAVILAGDDPQYPPLLGTGGNDGRLDFTNNFMQRLTELFDAFSGAPLRNTLASLDAALFGGANTSLSDRAIGQFSPGAAGGPNAASSFEGDARINPWDFVLMLEGAVLFSASTARKLETGDPSILAAPFTVRSRAGTTGSANANDDSDARGEIWMPLWSNAVSLAELRCLLSEGRAALNGRPTRDGLDFARAVAQLGVDRGIDSFQRYCFLMRSGKAFLAIPLNRIKVRRNVDADLIGDLERRNWIASVQRYARDDNAPNAFRSAARLLDMALFALAQQSNRTTLQNVLRQIGRIEMALSSSTKSREAVRTPVTQLSQAWAVRAGGEQVTDSPEFRIALALAGLRIVDRENSRILDMRTHLAKVSERSTNNWDRQWDATSALTIWSAGPLTANLATMLRRRRLAAANYNAEHEALASVTGATCDDIASFLAEATDDRKIAELLAGLACVDLNKMNKPKGSQFPMLPPAFVVLKILFTSNRLMHDLDLAWFPKDRQLSLPAEIPARLSMNDVQTAVRLAWQRLRMFDIELPGRDPPCVIGAYGPRWLAALCIPLTLAQTGSLISSLYLESKRRSTTESAI